MDGEFQGSEFIDEEFQHEGIEDEDPSQGFVDWDSPPTYDDDVNEEDPIEELLASDLEEEYEEYGSRPMFDDLYPDEDDQLEEKEPTDDIADYEEDDIANYEVVDEDFSGEVPNFNGQESDYVDFLGVEDILKQLRLYDFLGVLKQLLKFIRSFHMIAGRVCSLITIWKTPNFQAWFPRFPPITDFQSKQTPSHDGVLPEAL
jgi:hypothetical protein